MTDYHLGDDVFESFRYNEKYILHLLRLHQRESKANLARHSGLTAAAVGGIMASLQQKGVVEKVGKVQGDMGQPATMFSLAKSGAYGIGVSINRGHIETALMNLVGEVIGTKKHRQILPSPERALEMVATDIRSLLAGLPQEALVRVSGIGLAMPYQISRWQQENSDWSSWDDFDIAAELEREVGLRVYAQNDVNAAAMAEMSYGVSCVNNDFLYMFFGSSQVQSFGGGLMLKGECRTGLTGNAGDVGLIPVPKGKLLSKGSHPLGDCTYLNERCSLYSLVKYLHSEGFTFDDAESFQKVFALEPERVGRWIGDCVEALECALYAFQALVDVPTLIIDCEDADSALIERVIDGLSARLSSRDYPGITMPQVRRGSLGSAAASMGAATVPLDATLSPKLESSMLP